MTDDKLFSTAEAAEYLGVSLSTVKYHIYHSKTLRGQLIGRSLVFRQSELDQFRANKRGPGRPRKAQSCPSLDKEQPNDTA